ALRVNSPHSARHLRVSGGAGRGAGRDLPEKGGADRRDGTRQGAQGMSPPSATTTTPSPTWADVNRDVIRTVSMPGDRYFAWMCLVGLTLGAGVAAWAWQIWIGMGAA